MIEFFFDCSSPWTYLAFHNIQPLAKEFGAEITWRPILVGGIFNTINPSVYEGRERPVPAKARYSGKDLQDWARLAGLHRARRPRQADRLRPRGLPGLLERGCGHLQGRGDRGYLRARRRGRLCP